jgi:hypothetical protein
MRAIDGARQRLASSARLRLIVLAALVAAVALVVWLLALRGDDGGPGVDAAEGALGPVAMSVDELADFAAAQPHAIYWAGERPDVSYEVTRTEEGSVFVRYLDSEAEVGDERADFLTVATYPVDDAYDLVVAASEEQGAITAETPDGMLAVTNETALTSVYLADEASEIQIEIYDPSPGSALRIATSGDVEPVG